MKRWLSVGSFCSSLTILTRWCFLAFVVLATSLTWWLKGREGCGDGGLEWQSFHLRGSNSWVFSGQLSRTYFSIGAALQDCHGLTLMSLNDLLLCLAAQNDMWVCVWVCVFLSDGDPSLWGTGKKSAERLYRTQYASTWKANSACFCPESLRSLPVTNYEELVWGQYYGLAVECRGKYTHQFSILFSHCLPLREKHHMESNNTSKRAAMASFNDVLWE